MIIDDHAHLDPQLSIDGLLQAMDDAGVERAALIAAAQTPLRQVGRAGPVLLHACMRVPALRMPVYRLARSGLHQHRRPDNEAVFAAARAHPTRFLPYAFVNPMADGDAVEELDRRIAEGARGVKLHPWMHRYRLPGALPILQRAQKAELPVLAHLGFGPPEDVEIVLDAVPKLKLILAHAGVPHFERVWRYDKVFFDTAAVGLLISPGTVRRLVREVGPERVIFGSDAPVGLRARDAYRYQPPPLPSRCFGENLASLLD